eukprot:g10267.t1
MPKNSPQTPDRLRVLATDLDGTLIPLSGNVRNRHDLARVGAFLAANEMTLAFVTGRHLEITLDALAEHALPRPDWVICDVGTTICRADNETWAPLPAYIEHLESICAPLPIAELRDALARVEGLTLQEEEKQGPFKLSFYARHDQLAEVVGRIGNWLDEQNAPWSLIDSHDPFTGDGLIDLLPRDVSKAYAIEWWRRHCGFDTSEIAFAGDSGNDLAALVAGYRSIVVGNAERSLAETVADTHRREGWADRLHLARAHATSGVLEGLHAFAGSDAVASLRLGATPVSDTRTEFALWAPRRKRVDVEIERDGTHTRHPLEPVDGGCFRVVVDDAGPGTRYAFVLDGDITRPDPRSRFQPEGVHGPSQVIDPAAYQWRDDDWNGIDKPDLVIYELHVGTFTAEGTFRAAIDRLAELTELGITAVELLPVAQTPGRWNWGYDGVDLFAPSHHYGTPDDFRAFVDAAHAAGLAVILDVVYNHVGPEGNYLADFAPYFSRKHRTPWGEAFNYDGRHREQARRYIVDNALAWLDEYHLDGLRLDAVHCMVDESDSPILAEIRRAVSEYAATIPRRIHCIAETNVFDAELLAEAENAPPPYDAIWCDDLMQSIYAYLAPDEMHCCRSYTAGDLIESLRHGSIYIGPPDRRITPDDRTALRTRLGDSRLGSLVVALQNHDIVGNDPLGRRFHQITSCEMQKAAAALVLLYPSIPLLFMGEEFAADSPFRFFTDFENPTLRRAVERGREQQYPTLRNLKHASPTAPSAFTDSKLATRKKNDTWHWYRALLKTRQQWITTGLLDSRNLTVDHDPQHNLFTLRYENDGNHGFVLVRLTPPGEEAEAIEVGEPRGEQKTGGGKQKNGDAKALPVSSTPQGKPGKVVDKSALHLKPVRIDDRQGWGRPIAARVMLAPVKWKVEGGVLWRARAFKGEEIQERFAITRPDGLVRFEKVPLFRWGYSNSMSGNRDLQSYGTRVARVGSAEQAVRHFVLPSMRSKQRVKLVSITPNEKASAAATKAMQEQMRRSPVLQENRARVEIFAAKLAYSLDGRECEETLMLRMIASRQPTVSRQIRQFARQFGAPVAQQGFIDQYFLDGFAMRVPKGEWKQHEPLLTTMMASTRQNPVWVQAVAQHRRKMEQIRLKGMRDRHEIRMRTHREIAAMQQWSWEKRQATRDQQAAKFSRTIREVELYNDPVLGRPIELGAGYKFVYRNGQGEYLLFNNPLFDPNVELQGEWQKLRRAE